MMSKPSVRALIAEDDPVQRAALVDWVTTLQPGWEIVATAQNVEEVFAAIEKHAPNLGLIDIHLPGSESADWIKQLDGNLPVVFVTGDPEFAVHAFEANAIDYLLKPVTLRRLKQALERAAEDPRVVDRGEESTALGLASGEALQWITMSRGNDVLVVPPAEVIYLEADMKYTRVVSQRGEGLVRTGMNELCKRIADNRFVKIHRSVVVNLAHVSAVRRTELGHLDVHLVGRSDVLRVSKSYQHIFRSY